MVKQQIIPMLVYEDIEAAQRFLVEAFGFERGVLERTPSGQVVHAEVSVGGSVIWLHRVTPKHGLASARSQPAVPSGLVVAVDDVDAQSTSILQLSHGPGPSQVSRSLARRGR